MIRRPLRDGHETLLPSVTRSALSTKIPVTKIPVIEPRLDPSGFQDVSETPPAPRTDVGRAAPAPAT